MGIPDFKAARLPVLKTVLQTGVYSDFGLSSRLAVFKPRSSRRLKK